MAAILVETDDSDFDDKHTVEISGNSALHNYGMI